MADLLREEFGVESTLVKGHSGVFEVRVGAEIVAKKTWMGFPDEEEILREVGRALGG